MDGTFLPSVKYIPQGSFQNKGKVVTGRVSTQQLRLAFLKCSQANYHRIFKASNLEHANTGL